MSSLVTIATGLCAFAYIKKMMIHASGLLRIFDGVEIVDAAAK